MSTNSTSNTNSDSAATSSTSEGLNDSAIEEPNSNAIPMSGLEHVQARRNEQYRLLGEMVYKQPTTGPQLVENMSKIFAELEALDAEEQALSETAPKEESVDEPVEAELVVQVDEPAAAESGDQLDEPTGAEPVVQVDEPAALEPIAQDEPTEAELGAQEASLTHSLMCPACNASNEPTYKFCVKCGTSLEVVQHAPIEKRFCEQCGVPLTAGNRFCVSCGFDTQADFVPTAAVSTNPSDTISPTDFSPVNPSPTSSTDFDALQNESAAPIQLSEEASAAVTQVITLLPLRDQEQLKAEAEALGAEDLAENIASTNVATSNANTGATSNADAAISNAVADSTSNSAAIPESPMASSFSSNPLCEECGYENLSVAAFCKNCGSNL